MSVPAKPQLIEGVGDEIIYGGVTLLSAIITTVISFKLFFGQRQARIHPDFAATVESTRQRLNHQNGDHNGDHSGAQTDPPQQPQHVNRGQLTCPICLGEALYAVETNCGHLYCGQCFLTYWHHRDWFGAVPCPSCRTRVTLLLLNFTPVEATEGAGTAADVRQDVNNYNRRFSGEPRSLVDYLRDLPTLLRHAWTDERFSLRSIMFVYWARMIIIMVVTFVYLLSPFDIISESVLGVFGFLDDMIVIFLVVAYIGVLYRRFVAAQATDRENDW